MHNLQAEQYLPTDFSSLGLVDLSRKVGFKITHLDVFHGEEQVKAMLKPAKELYEQILLFVLWKLVRVSILLQVCVATYLWLGEFQ